MSLNCPSAVSRLFAYPGAIALPIARDYRICASERGDEGDQVTLLLVRMAKLCPFRGVSDLLPRLFRGPHPAHTLKFASVSL